MSVSVLTRALTLVGLFFEKRSYKRDEARRSEVRWVGVPWEGPLAPPHQLGSFGVRNRLLCVF